MLFTSPLMAAFERLALGSVGSVRLRSIIVESLRVKPAESQARFMADCQADLA
jgi:hypothetical protein